MTDRQPRTVRGPAVAAVAAAAIAAVLLFRPASDGAAPAPGVEPLAHSAPGKTSPPSPQQDGTPSSTAVTATPPAPSVPPNMGSPTATPDPRQTVLTGFAIDFARPGPDWVARTTRWTSDYLTEQFGQIDQTRVPAATLLSVEIHSGGEYSVDAAASYDTGLVLLMRAELTPAAGWVITTVRPANG